MGERHRLRRLAVRRGVVRYRQRVELVEDRYRRCRAAQIQVSPNPGQHQTLTGRQPKPPERVADEGRGLVL